MLFKMNTPHEGGAADPKDSAAIAHILADAYFKGIYERDVNLLGSTFYPGTLLFQSRLVSGLRQVAIAREEWEMLLLWSGQIAPVLKYRRAAELMGALVGEADAYFKGFSI
jgi:hypothetical protein